MGYALEKSCHKTFIRESTSKDLREEVPQKSTRQGAIQIAPGQGL